MFWVSLCGFVSFHDCSCMRVIFPEHDLCLDLINHQTFFVFGFHLHFPLFGSCFPSHNFPGFQSFSIYDFPTVDLVFLIELASKRFCFGNGISWSGSDNVQKFLITVCVCNPWHLLRFVNFNTEITVCTSLLWHLH